jgi:hypothetical protein
VERGGVDGHGKRTVGIGAGNHAVDSMAAIRDVQRHDVVRGAQERDNGVHEQQRQDPQEDGVELIETGEIKIVRLHAREDKNNKDHERQGGGVHHVLVPQRIDDQKQHKHRGRDGKDTVGLAVAAVVHPVRAL